MISAEPSEILPVWQIKSFDQLTAEQLYGILQLRIDVFVVEQNCPYPEADGADLRALHLWAEMDGKAVACCRIFPAGIKYDVPSIGRVATHADYRGLGLGKKLMTLAVSASASRHNTDEIQISAQDYLLRFYQDFGFAPTGRRYLEDNIPHTEMRRTGNK